MVCSNLDPRAMYLPLLAAHQVSEKALGSRLGLQEIWIDNLGNVTPLHESFEALPQEVTRILPAIHDFTGCDTTSKIGTNLQVFKAAQKPLNEDMFKAAETFLLGCMSRTANLVPRAFSLTESKYW